MSTRRSNESPIGRFALATCRCCLASDRIVRSLFEPESELARRIWECAEVRAEPDDGYPSGLCLTCADDLSRAHEFRTRCRRSDAYLRNSDELDLGPAVKIELVPDEAAAIKSEASEEEEKKRPKSERAWQCAECGKRLSSKKSLRRHASGHDPEKKASEGRPVDPRKVLTCDECGYSTAVKQCMANHARTHTGERPYGCDECGKTFAQVSHLSAHRAAHAGLRFACAACGKSYASKKGLRRHEAARHSRSARPACGVCHRRYASRESLAEHAKRHSGAKDYCCDACGARFATGSALRNHSLVHADRAERAAFECDYCRLKIPRKQSLEEHVLRHMKLRPYGCDACPLACYTPYELKRHKRKHAKREPRGGGVDVADPQREERSFPQVAPDGLGFAYNYE